MQLPQIRSIFGCARYKCVARMVEAFLQVSGKRKINQKREKKQLEVLYASTPNCIAPQINASDKCCSMEIFIFSQTWNYHRVVHACHVFNTDLLCKQLPIRLLTCWFQLLKDSALTWLLIIEVERTTIHSVLTPCISKAGVPEVWAAPVGASCTPALPQHHPPAPAPRWGQSSQRSCAAPGESNS